MKKARKAKLFTEPPRAVKPTRAGRAFIGTPDEQPPYRGAKPSFLISADGLEDPDWLAELIRISAEELPMPKAKKPKN